MSEVTSAPALARSGGTLHGVGVGPGDPELVTLRALRILDDAPVVAYPCTESGESMALTIVDALLDPDKVLVPLPLLFSPARTPDHPAYDAAANAIAAHLDAGADVAVICQGDPLFHGSFLYILERLGGRYAVEVTPGVSSVMACAAAVPRPIARGAEGLAVASAMADEAALTALLSAADAAVIMKVGRHLPKVARALDAAGLAEGAHCVTRVGHPDSAVRTLDEALALPDGVPYFTVILARRGSRSVEHP
jgi:precorrin-2/cobalt-factor-2 C20-methyltransferase